MHAMSSSQIRVYSECMSVFKCKFMCMCVLGVQESGSLIAFARLPTLKWPLPWGGGGGRPDCAAKWRGVGKTPSKRYETGE